eukprot:892283-Alexandrium_andersonii.AAC.1
MANGQPLGASSDLRRPGHPTSPGALRPPRSRAREKVLQGVPRWSAATSPLVSHPLRTLAGTRRE